MTVSRRDLVPLALAAVAAQSVPLGAADPPPIVHHHNMSAFPASWYGKEKIALLLYPQFTALDIVGPHYMLSSLMGSTVYMVAKTRDPVVSDQNVTMVPTTTFEECPSDLDVICVPGGTNGTLAAMKDEATIAFLKDRGARAKYVTSVCTGSLLLGAAGLLKGYKATSHWVTRDLLSLFGAEPVNNRIVIDRNRITGGGVTAGIDFGLTLAAHLRDADYAKALQLLAEYQPAPPFDAGTPERAPAGTTRMMTEMLAPFIDSVREAAAQIAQRG